MQTSIVNQLGLGSGIDTAALIRDLAAASRGPKAARLSARAEATEAKISSMARARSALEGFSASLSQLANGGTLRVQPASSNDKVLTAALSPGGSWNGIATSIEVNQLARPQSLYATPVADVAGAVGRGVLSLSIGGATASVTIDASNDSLTGLAQAVSGAGIGLTAAIVSDGDGHRLVVKGPPGQTNAFTIAAQPGSDPQLQSYAYGNAGDGLLLAQSAQDAIATIDGVPVRTASNTLRDAVPGLTLSLVGTAPGNPVTIGANSPVDSIQDTVSSFISAFNEVKAAIFDARRVVGSDQSLRMIQDRLSSLISRPVTTSGAIRSLSDIGLSSTRDGLVTLDANRLHRALAQDAEAVETLFLPSPAVGGVPSGTPSLSEALAALVDEARSPGGSLQSLDARLASEKQGIGREQSAMEARESRYAAQLERRFGGLDARLSALKSVQSYLDQQVKLWTRGS